MAHYCIVRKDIPAGNQAAQLLHAAGESAAPRPEPGCFAIALHADDEDHLLEISAKLDAKGIPHHLVHEAMDDDQWPGQLMAIGINPTTERSRIRKVLSSLPLVR